MGETNEELAQAPLSTIISTGLLLGIVHVITGPDHLSALVVLSAGSSWRSCQLGMRWGCGHSAGLILVAAIFLAVNQSFDIDGFGAACDFAVGILMILLGLWSLRHYLHVRKQYYEVKQVPESQPGITQVDIVDASIPLSPVIQTTRNPSPEPKSSFTAVHVDDDQDNAPVDATRATKKCCFDKCTAPSSDIKNPRTQKLTAFAYGTLHGLAGTGGVLGVLPAVVLNDWGRSSAYLLSFSLASIFIMGLFAATYGEITGRLSRYSEKLLYRIGLFSSGVSFIVGILWVILSATGQLDAVFG